MKLQIDTSINPLAGGGGTIGNTNDPGAPRVQLSDTEITERYPLTYQSLLSECKTRYTDFKADKKFQSLMRTLKQNPEVAYLRKLDPNNPNSPGQWRYRRVTILGFLDEEYTLA